MIFLGTNNFCAGIISFIEELECLKNTTRTAWTSQGKQESAAEHTFRVALFVLVMGEQFPNLNLFRALKLALIHDLGEAYVGDFSATLNIDPKVKLKAEEEGLERLIQSLQDETRSKITALFQEYNEGMTAEARFVKAIDKLETLIQHNQGDNPANFDYDFNLKYGREYTDHDEILRKLRELIDQDTNKRASASRLNKGI